jgi:hypothetical protein
MLQYNVYFQSSKIPFWISLKTRNNLRFPLRKTGNIFNNYTRGDFIIVGGRKTSESSFLFYIIM